jgi:uncharacterized repeat protein (TIGR03803 family)
MAQAPKLGSFRSNGDFYGTTYSGGSGDGGTVVSLSVGLSPFVKTQPSSGAVGVPVRILGRVPHADPPLERVLQFRQEVRPRSLDLVANALHAGVRHGVQGEGIEALHVAVPPAGPHPQFAEEEPLGPRGVHRALDNVERDGGRARVGVRR